MKGERKGRVKESERTEGRRADKQPFLRMHACSSRTELPSCDGFIMWLSILNY